MISTIFSAVDVLLLISFHQTRGVIIAADLDKAVQHTTVSELCQTRHRFDQIYGKMLTHVSSRAVVRPSAPTVTTFVRPAVSTRRARSAVAFATREGESDAMSAPMDIQPEQQEVFYSDEKLHKETPDLPSPTGESSESTARSDQPQSEGDHHFDKVVYKVAHETSDAHSEGGRFDEEPFMPDQPYSPKPSERGHGVPPHKDESNTHAPDRQ